MRKIKIAMDFSDVPLGRYYEDGKYSGQRFREEFLKPALDEDKVTVDIDDTEGYGSSFLEEAFGGLVRKGYYTEPQLVSRLFIECRDPAFKLYENLIWKYIKESVPE